MDRRSKESGTNKHSSLHLQKFLGTEHPCTTPPGNDKAYKNVIYLTIVLILRLCFILKLTSYLLESATHNN